MAPTPIKNVRLTPPICGPLVERRMNGAFRFVSGGIRHSRLMNSETDDRVCLMTNIDFAGPTTSKTRTTVRILGRGPRMSPRDAYAADHIIVDDRPVFRRRIERRVSPVRTVHGFRRRQKFLRQRNCGLAPRCARNEQLWAGQFGRSFQLNFIPSTPQLAVLRDGPFLGRLHPASNGLFSISSDNQIPGETAT